IIRGRWDIADYDFSVPFPGELRTAPQYGGLQRPAPDSAPWTAPLRAAAEDAQPFDRREFDQLKGRAEALGSQRVLEGMPHSRVGTTAVSDLVRVNRVQGLAFGLGGGRRVNGGYELRGAQGDGLIA